MMLEDSGIEWRSTVSRTAGVPLRSPVRAESRQVGEGLELERERVGVNRVPVQHVHAVVRERVHLPPQRSEGQEVPRRVHQHAAVREARGVTDGPGRHGGSCLTSPNSRELVRQEESG